MKRLIEANEDDEKLEQGLRRFRDQFSELGLTWVKHICTFWKVNQALIEAPKVAIFILEKEQNLSEEKRKSMIESLKGLLAQSEEIYGEAPAEHWLLRFG